MSSTYFAVSPPIHQLGIKDAFDGLTTQEKLYAHHMARAAWHGTRIILRQVSPESVDIYDFIIELHNSCLGNWKVLVEGGQTTQAELDAFLNYAATFLSNIGNYYGQGDQKFIPAVSAECLERLGRRSDTLGKLHAKIASPILAVPPYALGYPGKRAQSAYYPGQGPISATEVDAVSRVLEDKAIYPENTRLRKVDNRNVVTYELLQASVEADKHPTPLGTLQSGEPVLIVRGDHSTELANICSSLSEAAKYTSNDKQRLFLSQYIESFRTGSLHVYRDSQRTWIQDKNPRVENIFGFVEPYRDPAGIRSEFEARLPWAEGDSENNGKGPFEKALFEPPDFTSIHTLAYCSSIIFPGINLPNYNDLRQEHGFKNVIIANRMTAESNEAVPCPFVDPSEAEAFQKHKYPAYYWWVVLHELLGHGTGKLLAQDAKGLFNFDSDHPPINPLTGKPIDSWYKPGQTWTGQFGDLATTVDECRAELVGAYLMDDAELLALFGFTADSETSADDLTYNLYLQLGVDGLRGLANYNPENGTWGQAHSRAHFATLKCLLTDAEGFMTVDFNGQEEKVVVRIDRTKIRTQAKPALGRMLLRLHMYRSIADVKSCREYYEDLSRVDSVYLQWRDIVLAQKQPRWVFVQANTFLDGGQVVLKEYDHTPEGVIQSWAERDV
ncbi:Dipeptidyl peptidase 3 [Coniochaeta hoffmannii]|uniref:Dipeptidyl peptidase 3 n=1 Tax=Coniochaeta hoffmannii TaxID=91930 RepID=A0AA38R7C0_9PEZI|nr:Dipeptidyl peptidase 3 [Coniochaeta hoffmannii]